MSRHRSALTPAGPRPAAVAVLFAIAALLGGCSPPPAAGPGERPDVVLIVIDTFRPDHLGINGYARSTAPFLEGLMARSAVFRRAYSTSSWTAPATGSIFTSLYPTRHGVTEGFLAHQRRAEALEELVGTTLRLNRLPAEVETLPEILSRAGYGTFGLASNINVGPEIGFDRGFDRFRKLQDHSAKRLADELLSWRADLEAAEPSFVYLHFNDVHEPYQRRAPWYVDAGDELQRTVSAYDSEISFLDRELERLHRELEWRRDTLLIVVSDHGEEFREHGRIGHDFTLYDELMRVLLVVSGEDLEIPPAALDAEASLIDVAPTILDLVGIETPADRDGRSLAPRLTGTGPSGEASRTLFGHRLRHRVRVGKPTQHLWAAVRGPWKLIAPPDGEPRLFDRDRDPREQHDVLRDHPEIAAELGRELARFQAAGIREAEDFTEVPVDRETLEALKALGYIQ